MTIKGKMAIVAALAGVVGALGTESPCAGRAAPFPVWSEPRAVTQGPHEHLLASYFAIDSWSPNKRYLSVLETDLNGRLPEANERCTLGLVDLEDGSFSTMCATGSSGP